MQTRTAVIVLGMHRSGTSSVAGALVQAGAAAPLTLMPPAEDNPKGFWESSAVAEFNDQLLALHGSNWHDWHPLGDPAVHMTADLFADAGRLLKAEFAQARTIVLKDPRMCRLMPFWNTALAQAGYRTVVVSPVRPPSEVAASLVSRNAMSRSHALRLWMRHVLEAERFSRALPRRLVLWPAFLTDWRDDLNRFIAETGLSLTLDLEAAGRIGAFLSRDLHRQSDAAETPGLIARTYSDLVQIARHGEHPDLHRALDARAAAFDQACEVFEDAPH